MPELSCDVLIVGGGAGGCAAALAAASLGRRVILTEQTHWIGGQLTAQAVPPDENLSIETIGCTGRYRAFRNGVRDDYRRHYPLTPQAAADPTLNPGGGYVSGLCFEPRVGHAVLQTMFAGPTNRGNLRVFIRHVPVDAEVDGDRIRAVRLRDLDTGALLTITASYVLDATELGDLLPMAGVEYVVGAESSRDTGEPNAIDGDPQPQAVQAMTWCFPMARDTTPGAHHVIDRPAQYDRWRQYVPATNLPWPGPLLSWTVAVTRTGRHAERSLYNTDGWFRGLWDYRKIVCADHYAGHDTPHEVTLVNWPQNDYFVRSPIDVPDEERNEIFEEARQLSLSLLFWIQTEAPRHDGGVGYPEMYLRPDLVGSGDGMALYPYIRESRRIRARFTVLEQHVSRQERRTGAEPFADSVGIGHYGIDLHNTVTGAPDIAVQTWPFQIPLRALLPIRVENLLPACKNIGTTHITNGCYRLHPIEWNIGEAAGLLAAFCLDQRVCPHAVGDSAPNAARLLADFQRLAVGQGFELAWS